jgi:hypothetical protein
MKLLFANFQKKVVDYTLVQEPEFYFSSSLSKASSDFKIKFTAPM